MLRITKYYSVNKGYIVGSFNCEIVTDYGPAFYNKCTLFEKDGRRWASFYSESYEKDGKKSYFPIAGFTDKKGYEKFQEDVKKALALYFEKSSNQSIDDEIPF